MRTTYHFSIFFDPVFSRSFGPGFAGFLVPTPREASLLGSAEEELQLAFEEADRDARDLGMKRGCYFFFK